ncbi:MAG: class I SAM-dependent methyltransferase [Acidobacteria bacterium]|nr:class I SAM-dependent methyltransferase [Acidobacteriota bacterium]
MSAPGDRVDFSGNAPVYDKRHGAFLPDAAVRELATVAGLDAGTRLLDVGAGTGRVAIPFAAMGCRVVGLDASPAMLHTLAKKAESLPARLVVGDGCRLPFRDARFDVVVVARMLYLLPRWRDALLEITRVLAPSGRMLHEWGNGAADEAWVRIREKARSLFEVAGLRDPFHPGARTEDDVDACLSALGLRQRATVHVDNDVQMTLADFVRRIVDGECSYIWNVSKEIQRQCLPELQTWAAANFDLSQPAFTRDLAWTVYRR